MINIYFNAGLKGDILCINIKLVSYLCFETFEREVKKKQMYIKAHRCKKENKNKCHDISENIRYKKP